MRNPLDPTRPFRWDVTRRECLGSLVARPGENLWYLEELGTCAAKVLARCSNARQLYFVGRSPASICDYLTGALREHLVGAPASIDGRLWSHFGDFRPRWSVRFHHGRWGQVDGPVYDDDVLDALATAVTVVELGRTLAARRRLAGLVAAEREFSERWVRALVAELRDVNRVADRAGAPVLVGPGAPVAESPANGSGLLSSRVVCRRAALTCAP